LRTAFVSIFILFVGALVFGFWPRPIQIYHDTNVTVGEMSRKIDLLFLHPSPQRSLEFAGKRYPAIRGSGPCYLEIPDLRSILFVTQDRSHLATAYIAELQTKTVTPIGLGVSTFGRSIGSGKQPGDNGSDYVTVTNGNKVVLVTRSRTREATTTLDLARRAVEREEVVSFDKTGAVTNRAVFVAGIQVFRACK